ncbi:MAG: efflux RND transporter periplasmic adaptor subunit [Lysobacteraceae bacterium]
MIPDTSAQDQRLTPDRRVPRQWLLAGAGLVLLVLALVWIAARWSGASQSFDASRLRIAQVTRGDLVRDIAADGRVITANSPTLYAIAGGTVSLKVVAGDAVTRGQELASIDSPELRSRLVQEAATLASLQGESRRAGLDAQLARFEAQKLLDQARIEHTAAQRELERSERAFERGAVPRNDLDRSRDNLRKAEVGLEAARQSQTLQSQGASIDAQNKHLMAERQQAVVDELQRQVDALTLRAPFDGQVGQVQVAQGSNVTVNAPVLAVVDLSEFEVEIRVPESFARDLAIGVPAQIRSSGRDYAAQVAAVSPEVVNGEVTARLRFGDGQQPLGLRQNQRLSARIVLDRRDDVLMVERGPFLEQGGGRFAWVVHDGVAERRPIQAGASSLNAVEIVSGLAVGEQVIVSGADGFGDAQRVRVRGIRD